jgi:hypothetical protein
VQAAPGGDGGGETDYIEKDTFVLAIAGEEFLGEQVRDEDREWLLGRVESVFTWSGGRPPYSMKDCIMAPGEKCVILQHWEPLTAAQGHKPWKQRTWKPQLRTVGSVAIAYRAVWSMTQIMLGFEKMNGGGVNRLGNRVPAVIWKSACQCAKFPVRDVADGEGVEEQKEGEEEEW